MEGRSKHLRREAKPQQLVCLGTLALFVHVAGCSSHGESPTDTTSANAEVGATSVRKHALVFGGAATVDTPQDQFGDIMVQQVAWLDALGYDTTVLFSDGLNDIPCQAQAAAQLAQRCGELPAAFTRENLEAALTDLVERVGAGDEVLIAITTHGFACRGWTPPAGSDPNVAGPEAFCLALGAPRPADNWAEIPFDDLRPWLDELEAKGAWTGLLVGTCDSGNALRVAGARTCVTSATGYGTSHRTAFMLSYLDHVQGGMTLRDAYWAALPYTNGYEQCAMPCPDDPNSICAECAYYDTPWLSAEEGLPADPCDAFVL